MGTLQPATLRGEGTRSLFLVPATVEEDSRAVAAGRPLSVPTGLLPAAGRYCRSHRAASTPKRRRPIRDRPACCPEPDTRLEHDQAARALQDGQSAERSWEVLFLSFIP